MTDKKFTDEEIKSSLEVIATTGNCNECKIRNCKWGTCNCSQITANAALDLINRLKAENEMLKAENKSIRYCYEQAKSYNDTLAESCEKNCKRFNMTTRAEAIKEFVEKLNDEISVDVAKVVRCKDCKYMKTIFPMKSKGKEAIEAHVCYLSKWSKDSHGVSVMESDYCSYGERAEQK